MWIEGSNVHLDLPAVRARGAPIVRRMPGLQGQREIRRNNRRSRRRKLHRPAWTAPPGSCHGHAPTRLPSTRLPRWRRWLPRSMPPAAARRPAHMAAGHPLCVRFRGCGRRRVLWRSLFPRRDAGGFHAAGEIVPARRRPSRIPCKSTSKCPAYASWRTPSMRPKRASWWSTIPTRISRIWLVR
jgi:hypothetical protein